MKNTDNTRFIQREEGGGTVFSLFVFMVLCVILGVMVDATNAWRNSTMLASAADMGSHAGAVALANESSEADALSAARAQVRSNLPLSIYGSTAERDGDVWLLHYDPDTRQLYDNGPRNAVAVRANRMADRSNAVGTFLLKFAGVLSWNVNQVSVAVFDVSSKCLGTDGIYSEEQIRVSSQGYFATGYCVHSNERVWLPQQVTFEPDTQVSMPDLADCSNKCNTEANPGIYATEVNMIFPDFGDFIQETFNAFDADNLDDESKAAFFEERSVGDLDLLVDAGLVDLLAPPLKGSVVEMSHAEFHALEALPAGLVYKVMCPAGGNGPGTKLSFSGSVGQMRDAALLTNCSLDFRDGSEVQGSLIVTTRDASSATVISEQDVTIGDTVAGSCSSENRTTIMSVSGVSVPAKFAASNVTLIVDDTVDIAGSSASGDTSYGLTIYAEEAVDIAAQHRFVSCGQTDETFLPRGKLIRHVATN